MRKHLIWVLSLLAFVCLVDIHSASALPAFARREGAACQMCHFRMPELNSNGNNYILRGFREEPPATTATTTPVAAKSWPLGVPLPIQWSNYLSIMGDHQLTIQKGARPTFNAGGIDLWAGGAIDPHWSAIGDMSFDIQNGGSSVDQAYGQYISNWDNKFWSVRAGQTIPMPILLHQAGPPALPLSQPLILSQFVNPDTQWTPNTDERGVELGYVNLNHWNVYVGAGQPALPVTPPNGQHIDYYGSADYYFGPGHGDSVTLWGYLGEASLASGSNRSFNRVGVFSNLYWPSTKAILGYVNGNDDTDSGSLHSSGFFVQGERLLSDHWSAYARYDWMKADLTGGGSSTADGPALGISWWPVTPIRLTLEGQIVSTSGAPQTRIITTDFLWAF